MTLALIQAAVNANVIDLTPTVAASVPKLINDAIRTAERKYNFKYMEGGAAFTTVPGVLPLGTVPLFKEFRGRGPFLNKQYAPSERIFIADTSGDALETFTLNVNFPDKPRNIIYTLTQFNDVNFTVVPYPDALSDWNDGNWHIFIPYYKFSAPLVSASDSNWLTENGDDYIIYQATGDAFSKDWDYNSAAVWFQRATNAFTEVKQTDKKQRLSGFDTWVPHWEGANQGMVNK